MKAIRYRFNLPYLIAQTGKGDLVCIRREELKEASIPIIGVPNPQAGKDLLILLCKQSYQGGWTCPGFTTAQELAEHFLAYS